MVIRIGRVYLINRVFWGVNVESEVNAGSGERLHAGIVVCAVVDSVDTERVDTELSKSTETAIQYSFQRLA